MFCITFLCSCAHSRDWGAWTLENISSEKQVWRRCTEILDGPNYANKGECYSMRECRTRKTILGNQKKECRRFTLFCGWGDIECMQKHNTFNSVIINKGEL